MPTPQPRVVIDPQTPSERQRRAAAARPRPAVTDIRQTKEYKLAARRWVSTIVALPILMYTSWVLYDRTYGNAQPKRLVRRPGDGNGEIEGVKKEE